MFPKNPRGGWRCIRSWPRSVLAVSALLLCFTGCSDDNDKTASDAAVTGDGKTNTNSDGTTTPGDSGTSGDAITITGTLVQPAKADGPVPLVGYSLYCVTMTEPPVAGKGVADDQGKVTVRLEVKQAAFGCFILDKDGKGVASVIFGATEDEMGQMIEGSGSLDLGEIKVTLETHTARATVSSDKVVKKTPTTARCPVGTWVADLGDMGCPGKLGTSKGWIVKDPSGSYSVSYISGPFGDKCEYQSGSIEVASASFANNVLTMPPIEMGDECAPDNHKIHSKVEFDAECKTGTETGTVSGCENCNNTDPKEYTSCKGCGTTSCPIKGTVMTRQ